MTYRGSLSISYLRAALLPNPAGAKRCAPSADRSDVMGRAWSSPTTAPRGGCEIMLLLTSAVPAPGVTDTPTPTKALRITLPEITPSRRYLPQPATIPNDGAFSITLPDTEVSAST